MIKKVALITAGLFMIGSIVVASGFQGYGKGSVGKGLSFAWTNNMDGFNTALASITVTTPDDAKFAGSNVTCDLVRYSQTQRLFSISCYTGCYWEADGNIRLSDGSIFIFNTPWSGAVYYVIDRF